METGDWILVTGYLILDIGCWLLGTIAHEFDRCGHNPRIFLRILQIFWLNPDGLSFSGYDERWRGLGKLCATELSSGYLKHSGTSETWDICHIYPPRKMCGIIIQTGVQRVRYPMDLSTSRMSQNRLISRHTSGSDSVELWAQYLSISKTRNICQVKLSSTAVPFRSTLN